MKHPHTGNVRIWHGLRLLRGTFFRNILSLYGVQALNYLAPLITLPYVVRILGPQQFGEVAFGQGLVALFMVLVNYGFDWSATREVARAGNDSLAISRLLVNTLSARILLAIISISALVCVILFVGRIREHSVVLYALSGMVMGSALMPTWLFRGLERMPTLLWVDITVNFIGTLCTFVAVRTEKDFVIYAALLSFQSISTGAIAIAFAYRMFKLSFFFPKYLDVFESLRRGWLLFLSTSALNVYTAGNAFILGLLANSASVGFYVGAEKLARVGSIITGPISQAAYPRSSKMAAESVDLAIRWGRILILIMGTIGLLICLFLIILGPHVVNLILGNAYGPSVIVLRILAIGIFLRSLTHVWGIQIMLPLGHDKAFLWIIVLAGVTNILLALYLVPSMKEVGMALSVIAAEFMVAVLQPWYLGKKHLL